MFHEPVTWTPQLVLDWAGDTTLSPKARLRSAAIVSIFADNSYKADLVTEAYRLVHDLRPSELLSDDAALVEMVFHTTVGNATAVPSLATEYARMVRRIPDKLTTVRGLRRSGNAFRRVGMLGQAVALMEEALFLSMQLRLPQQELSTLEQLVSSFCELTDVINGQRVLALLAEKVNWDSRFSMKLALCCHGMTLAWLTSDTDAAVRLLADEISPPGGIQEMPRHSFLASRLGAVSLAQASALSSDDILECRLLHERGRALGQQDLKTSMLLEAMRLSGNATGAQDLGDVYLRVHRREITSPRLDFPFRYGNSSM